MSYINYSKIYKLKLECSNPQIIAYSDADFATHWGDRMSMGGHLIFLSNAPITQRTAKQKRVCLPTMESEFTTATDAVKELI